MRLLLCTFMNARRDYEAQSVHLYAGNNSRGHGRVYRQIYWTMFWKMLLCCYDSTALFWALAAFSVSWSYIQAVGLPVRGITPSQSLYLHTEQHKHRINAHNTDIRALSGIRTHNPSVRASEDSSCLRPRGHCDRLENAVPTTNFI
jgi:hypothetical protein